MTASRRIRLIAPSGYCVNQAAAQRGIARLSEAGHQVENLQAVTRRFQRFAGDDQQRLDEINQLAELDSLPDIVMAVRGGYGVGRLLESINYPALQRRLQHQPLALCGHSDFTALQLALLAECGLISFSSPMLAGNFGAEIPSSFTEQHFWQALTSETYTLNWQTLTPDQGTWQGQLWGGNLAMICSLIGTRWMPQIENGILVIEDINEHPFRVERMLNQLQQCGILARQQAIITGSFSKSTVSDYDQGFDLDSVWQRLRAQYGLVVVSDLAYGHEADTVTLPVGAQAQLNVSEGNAKLAISGHPILRR
ncbi:muramoyltetrapeptide carboxypeptidase [Pantoea sp. A4]|uniref:muramoyltetrapeptide carboxypeptidase n=1 Tax=Pantoea sp. A4 TaxID=1225184 RepID=UPI000376F21D|nr:muramoyltetrapeptide carboxypeptidase [Pantoea sp. A4]